MTAPVAANQRFTRSNPCPICHGHKDLPQGERQRCYGFLSSDGSYVHCTRPEHAGNLQPGANGDYAHRLKGDCNCGVRHDPTPRRSPFAVPKETVYRLRWGDSVIEHVRLDYANGDKRFYFRRDGLKGLAGLRTANLPLWPEDRLERGKPVTVSEGEKSAKALLDRGLNAVGTACGAPVTPCDESLRPLLDCPTVYLWPDADGDGEVHMRRIADALHRLGHDDIRVIRWHEAPPKGDAADYLGSDEELAALFEAAEPRLPAPESEELARPALRFRTARELAAATPEEPDHVVAGLLVRGVVTELSAKVKVGKTTFVLDMLAAVLGRTPFLGLSVKPTPIVYLTEERPASFRAALARVGLIDSDDLHILSLHDASGVPWQEVVAGVVSHATAVGAGVIVVDTLSRWARIPGDDENSAGVAAEAVEPLEGAAAEGVAVLVIRHDRKSGGELGDSARGSSAFGGAADIILNLRRANTEGHETRRMLLGIGRFDDVPSQLTIELRDNRYVVLGDALEVERQEAKEKLLDFLPGSAEAALTEEELLDRLGVARTTLRRALTELVQERRIARDQRHGKSGRAFGYWLADVTTVAGDQLRMDPGQVTSDDSQAHAFKRSVTDDLSDVTSPRPPGHNDARDDVTSPHLLIGHNDDAADNPLLQLALLELPSARIVAEL